MKSEHTRGSWQELIMWIQKLLVVAKAETFLIRWEKNTKFYMQTLNDELFRGWYPNCFIPNRIQIGSRSEKESFSRRKIIFVYFKARNEFDKNSLFLIYKQGNVSKGRWAAERKLDHCEKGATFKGKFWVSGIDKNDKDNLVASLWGYESTKCVCFEISL